MLTVRLATDNKKHDALITALVTIFKAFSSSDFNLKVVMHEDKSNNKATIDIPVMLNDLDANHEYLVDTVKCNHTKEQTGTKPLSHDVVILDLESQIQSLKA